MDKANEFLNKIYWPKHNTRFAINPKETECAFVPWLDSGMNLHDILCIQEQRTVTKDNTVSYNAKILQIPKQQDRCHYVKATVRIHEYSNGSMAIFHGPRKLANYDSRGNLIETVRNRKKAA